MRSRREKRPQQPCAKIFFYLGTVSFVIRMKFSRVTINDFSSSASWLSKTSSLLKFHDDGDSWRITEFSGAKGRWSDGQMVSMSSFAQQTSVVEPYSSYYYFGPRCQTNGASFLILESAQMGICIMNGWSCRYLPIFAGFPPAGPFFLALSPAALGDRRRPQFTIAINSSN